MLPGTSECWSNQRLRSSTHTLTDWRSLNESSIACRQQCCRLVRQVRRQQHSQTRCIFAHFNVKGGKVFFHLIEA